MGADFLMKLGEKYLDFVLTKHIVIEELNCVLRELTHIPSGAQIVHLENDDPENLFSLSFKTLPESSNGAPHILEHTVLCGSKKFPVKDPFFSMTRRSLNTFMNALTGADFTCYPAASQVEKDFYNLLDVYLDAVFHPELKKVSFLQEGCRLEFTDPKDPYSPLEYKGIVFNEMKGSLGSPDTRLWHAMMETLVPDLPYCYNSGGDPKVIPQLSYGELIKFYETYYHPSRCLFFFYGSMPLKKHLDFIFERALKNVKVLAPLPPLPIQKRFTMPIRQELTYPVSDEDTKDRNIVSFGWLTCRLVEQEEVLALSVLDSILMDSDASPLKQKILQSGLCAQADAFIDLEMSELPYVITCKGCIEGAEEDLEKFLFSSLAEIAAKPIPQHLIDAAIHQMELSRLEIVGDHAPFGLTLFLRSALAKQHGCEPENSLVVYALFKGLIEKTKDPYYLPGILKKHLINNSHFVRIVLKPDPKLAQKEAEEEKISLQKIKEALSKEEKQKIIRQAQELEEYQKHVENQNLNCLPKVTLDDVPMLSRDFPVKRTSDPCEIFYHETFTNHILYADLLFDLPHIEEDDLPYLQLLLTLLSEVGAADRSYTQNLEYIQAHTGGIGFFSSLHVQAADHNLLKPCFSIRGKALDRKSDKLFTLFRDALIEPRIDDKKRVEELLKQLYSSMQSRLPKNALRYAIQLALSGFNTSAHINQACFGIRYYHTIQEICKHLESNLSPLVDRLIHLKNRLFSYRSPHLVLSCSEKTYSELLKEDFYGLFSFPVKEHAQWKGSYPILPVTSQARTIATQVAYSVKAYTTVPYVHPYAPALTVATQLFDNIVLLRKIREKGGAYGAGANYSPTTGCFYFHSYRDPHIASTLEAFDSAIDKIAAGKFSSEDLEEAKLGIIQQFDAPISPGSRAITAYGWWRDGKTRQMRQEFRDKILGLSAKELVNAVAHELLPNKEKGIVVTFGPKSLIEKENRILETKGKALPIFSI